MVQPNGRLDAPIVIVGDAPSDLDIQNDRAFSGPTYDLLHDLLGQSDFTLSDCVFVNAVTFQKYLKRGALTAADIRPDADKHLIPFITQHPREMVIALGNNAVCAVGLEKKPEKVGSHRSKRSKSTLLEEKGCEAIVTASIHPWFILKEPDLDVGALCDFKYANRLLKADFTDQVPMEIRDIKTPADMQMVWDALQKNPRMAYDFETTDLNRDKAFPVTLALCNGLKNQKGEFIVWFWCGFDQLQPLFDDDTMEEFKSEFDTLFSEAGKSYDLIAWNAAYDDWIAERWVGHELPGSQFDGMLMKWSIDNRRPHGLKESTARFLGYPNYDKPVDEAVKEIKDRRGRILKDKVDLDVLAYFGHEPEKAKTGVKWPKNVDKGLAAYALQPYETLRTYNCYDAVYTYLLFEKLGERINRENLAYSCDFRHRIARELIRCEQRGMLCDVKLNREFSDRLLDIEKKCEVKIMDELKKMGVDMPDFNHRSGDQLAEVLYGKPLMLPFIDRSQLYAKYGKIEGNLRCDYIETMVYGDVQEIPEIKHAIENNFGVDIPAIEKRLRDAYDTEYGGEIVLYEEPYYVQGMYTPIGYTKSGKPSTAGAVLQTLYQMNQNPFLALVLMARRANKLRGTFVDGIYSKLDEFYVLRSRFNAIGTETGRISSCVRKGTLIEAERGVVPIEKLKTGDLVYGHDGELHQCVTNAFEKPKAMFYKVCLESGDEIECTAAHRFLTQEGWKTLSELSVDETVVWYDKHNYEIRHSTDYGCGVGTSKRAYGLLREAHNHSRRGVLSACDCGRQDAGGDEAVIPRDVAPSFQHLDGVLSTATPRMGVEQAHAEGVFQIQDGQQIRGQACKCGCATGGAGAGTRENSPRNSQRTQHIRVVRAAVNGGARDDGVQDASKVDRRGRVVLRNAGTVLTGDNRSGPALLRRSDHFLFPCESVLGNTAQPALVLTREQVELQLSLGERPDTQRRQNSVGAESPRVDGINAPTNERSGVCPTSGYQTSHVGFLGRGYAIGGDRRKLPSSRREDKKARRVQRADCVRTRPSCVEVDNRSFRQRPTRVYFGSQKIARITMLGEDIPWDITVDKAHSYLAHGFVNHNSNPNGQNFQKNIRGQLIPRPGYKFLEWDLSQAEIRGIAAESGDPLLIAALDASDIHTRIASMIFKIPESEVNDNTHRRYAKTIVFGLIYGMSAYRLALAINVTLEEAEQFMADFFAAFPVMKQWLDNKVKQAHRSPYYVYTPWGTRRSTRNVLSVDRGVVSHTERIATNMPIQGGAGELCLWYICEIMDKIRAKGLDAWLVNTTHDSCTLEVREDLVWEEDLGELDKKGRSNLTICGPVADIVREVIATPPPVSPLNRVTWKADLELNDWWSAEPNLNKALDPNLGKEESIFRWELIKPAELLDYEEQEELRELEEVMTGVKANF